jgi:hypothetical protein
MALRNFMTQYGTPLGWTPPAPEATYGQLPNHFGARGYAPPWTPKMSAAMVPWAGPAASTAALPTYPGWTAPTPSYDFTMVPDPTTGLTTAGGVTRVLLHGLLGPGQLTEAELQAVESMVELARAGLSNKAALSDFTVALSQSLGSLHYFDSLSWLLTRVAEPVQAAWVAHDRLRTERTNVIIQGPHGGE